MKIRMFFVSFMLVAICTSRLSLAAEVPSAVNVLLQSYLASGASEFSAERGKIAWQKKMTPKPGQEASCSTCHGTDLKQKGEHAKTHKVIDPMAISIQSDRYQDVKKIKKWFKRNCKWAWGRECTSQEKGDFLAYLTSQ